MARLIVKAIIHELGHWANFLRGNRNSNVFSVITPSLTLTQLTETSVMVLKLQYMKWFYGVLYK